MGGTAVSRCELFHGTSSKFLKNIERHGLLPPDKAPQVNYSISVGGIVCAVDSDYEAEGWATLPVLKYGGEIVVLCLDAVELITAFDRNLSTDTRTPWSSYGYEIPDGVPPERIRIHSRTSDYPCVPLSAASRVRASVDGAEQKGF